MPKAESNTFLSLVARDMQNVDFSESIFRRIKRKDTEKDGDGLERFVTDLYTKFNESAKPDKELWWLKEILGSDGLWVPRGNVIENVIKKKLYEKSGYEKELNPKTWTENLMDHMFNKHGNYKEEKLIPEQRKHWLNQYIKTAEDYFVNDNIGGFLSQNVQYNPLDYVVSYWFEIIDVIENDRFEPGKISMGDWFSGNNDIEYDGEFIYP